MIPYHPQSKCVLERWHRCLKQMLRKIGKGQGQLDKLLKYCLPAYKATSHIVTGYSPYQLVHGRIMRGPLETMKDSWIGGKN